MSLFCVRNLALSVSAAANTHNYNRGMDTSRSVGRNIGWADSRILGRHTLRSPDTNQTLTPTVSKPGPAIIPIIVIPMAPAVSPIIPVIAIMVVPTIPVIVMGMPIIPVTMMPVTVPMPMVR